MTVKQGIVFGAPRSGTTFLMRAVKALPRAEAVTGNLLPVGIVHLAAQELPEEVIETLDRSFAGALADYMGSEIYLARYAALRKWWVSSRRAHTLSAAVAGRRSETTLVYKEPFLALAPDFAFRALPDARLLYLLRDGRDVADSLVRTFDVLSDEKLRSLTSNEVMLGRPRGERFVPWWVAEEDSEAFLAAGQYARTIWMWREMVRRCQAFLDSEPVLGSGRVLTVRYEQLMSDPITQGERIVGHLGQELSPAIRRVLEGAHSRSVGNHARRDPAEIAEAELLAGPELEMLGYTRPVSVR